jgi:hypothetical protein
MSVARPIGSVLQSFDAVLYGSELMLRGHARRIPDASRGGQRDRSLHISNAQRLTAENGGLVAKTDLLDDGAIKFSTMRRPDVAAVVPCDSIYISAASRLVRS